MLSLQFLQQKSWTVWGTNVMMVYPSKIINKLSGVSTKSQRLYTNETVNS